MGISVEYGHYGCVIIITSLDVAIDVKANEDEEENDVDASHDLVSTRLAVWLLGRAK